MRTSLLPILILLGAATPAAAAESVSGKWQVYQSIVGNESQSSCTFKQTGGDLSGTCVGGAGEVEIKGKVNGDQVSWSLPGTWEGTPFTMNYSGKLVSPEKITGTVGVDPFGVEGSFTATVAK